MDYHDFHRNLIAELRTYGQPMTIIDAIGVGASTWRLMWLTRFTRRKNESWRPYAHLAFVILDLIAAMMIGGIVFLVLVHLGVHLTW